MKLLIIGGTGVLSGAVAREAIRQGIEVYILHRGTKMNLIPEGANSILADIKDSRRVESVLCGMQFDSLIDFLCYKKNELRNNYQLLHKYTKQYIFISTACVYDTSIPGVKQENAPKVLNSWSYSREKWECEEFLMEISKCSNIPYTIVRPAVTYDDTRIPYGITPVYGYHWTLIGRILADKPIITWDEGRSRWNLLRVEDFALGVVAVIGNKNAYNEAYNISGDIAYSWMDVLNTLSKVLNHNVKIYNLTTAEYISLYPGRAGEISARALDSIIDNSKIKALTPSFNMSIDLETGIKMVVDAYKKNNYFKGIDYRYDGCMDRIIKRSKRTYNARFVDYLSDSTLKEKLSYYCAFYQGTIKGKFLSYLMKVVR